MQRTSRILESLQVFNTQTRPGTSVRRRLFFSSRSVRKSDSPNPSSSQSSTAQAPHDRVSRLQNSRLFRPLYTRILSPLRNAPVSTITAFLIVHELTAVIPLLTLAGVFHYTEWLPAYFSEGAWVVKGVEMFGRYFRRKGWITDQEELEAERKVKRGKGQEVEQEGKSKTWKNTAGKWFGRGEVGTRLVMEFATAWAIVKIFLPLRLAASVWWAEGFARNVVRPFGRVFRRKGKGTKGTTSGAAGTGAVGGGGTSSGKGT